MIQLFFFYCEFIHIIFGFVVQIQACNASPGTWYALWLSNIYMFYFFVWFGFMFHVPVNNYGHVEMANLPNNTFSLGKLD